VHNSVEGAVSRYGELLYASEENHRLRAQVESLTSQNNQLREFASQNQRLRALLGMTESKNISGPVAHIVGYGPSVWSNVITVNKGSRDGVKQGYPVISGSGIVGQVASVAARSSQILLITDPTSGVDALIQDTRAHGVIEGRGREKVMLRYIDMREPVAVGDMIVTSGFDGVYPVGFPIGRVVDLKGKSKDMFQEVEVAPVVDFAKMEEVLIVVPAEPGRSTPEPEGGE
jgi:rod shape-determining protein MreC